MRDAYSKVFRNNDGTFSKTQAEYPLHYKDSFGRWLTYNSEAQDKNGLIIISGTDKPVSVNAKSGENTIFLNPGKSMTWGDKTKLVYINSSDNEIYSENKTENTDYSLKDNFLVMPNYFKGFDRLQYLSYYEIKTDFLINEKPIIPEGSKYLVLQDEIILPQGYKLSYFGGEKGKFGWHSELEIYDDKGVPVGGFTMPIAYDEFKGEDREERAKHLLQAEYQIEKSKNGYLVKILIPTDWLLDVNRVYPVTIDPTASNTAPSSNIGLSQISTNNGTNTCSTSTTVTLPSSSTVSNVNFSYTITAVYSSSYKSDQRSRMEGPSANESAYSSGSGSTTGDMNYSRSSTSILTGTVSGNQTFTLRHYQTLFVGTSACDLTIHRLKANTFSVTVTYTSACSATTYYSKSTGDLDQTSSWSSTADGTGCSPANFTTAGVTYIIQQNLASNVSRTIGANWTVSGSGSIVILGQASSAAVTFTVPSGYTFSGTIDVAAAASGGSNTLVLNNTTVPTLGTLDNGSTVQYNASGTQTIQATSYGNLQTGVEPGTTTNCTKTVAATGTLSIAGNLTIGDYSTFNLNDRDMTLTGDFIRTSTSSPTTSLFSYGSGTSNTVTFNGSSQEVNVTAANGTTPTNGDITFNHILIDGIGTNVKLFYFKTYDRKLNINNFTVNSGAVVTLYSNPQ